MSAMMFIPASVLRARAGFIRNPAACWSIHVPKWIPAPKKSVAVDMAAVDHTVDVLQRFVASWVAQSRNARREYAVRAAGEKWRLDAWNPAWSKVMENEDVLAKLAVAREHTRLISMTEPEWHAYCREQIRLSRDVGPLMVAWTPINVKRRAIAERIAEHDRVWQEMSRATLHNPQRPAQVRVARVTGRFAALDGSDSE
jgi:hypothetical protein